MIKQVRWWYVLSVCLRVCLLCLCGAYTTETGFSCKFASFNKIGYFFFVCSFLCLAMLFFLCCWVHRTRKTAGRHDACTRAQEKLHPSCAQRPDPNESPLSNSVSYTSALPGCHVNAEYCREDPNCR